jgi:hypothetical protein
VSNLRTPLLAIFCTSCGTIASIVVDEDAKPYRLVRRRTTSISRSHIARDQRRDRTP